MTPLKRRLFGAALIGSSALVLAMGIALVMSDQYSKQSVNVQNVQVFEIAPGMSLNQLAEALANQEIIPSARLFSYYARIDNWVGETSVKAGEYALTEGDTVSDLLTRFQLGRVIQHRVTFPEGWTIAQWRDHLRAHSGIVVVEDLPTDASLMATIAPDAGLQPEGMFYPDTYYFRRGESEISILRRAYERMQNVLADEWRRRGEVPLMSPYEALILASIVEKETGLASDRDMVASVFTNRLRKGQRLESDPTVIYGITDFDGDITRRHLRTETPYNTYRRHGLPPTPICNPGRAAIAAVLNPAVSDYLYFVARGDGSSQFSRTLQEHEAAVRRFQLGKP